MTLDYSSARCLAGAILPLALGAVLCAAAANAARTATPAGNAGDFWLRTAVLTPPADEAAQYFGVALDASGEFVVAGSQATVDGVAQAGQVHVYRREGSQWLLDATLTSPDGAQAGALFGYAVSIASTPERDVIVVGEPGRDRIDDGNAVADAGAAWVYERVDGVWVGSALASFIAANAQFGFSVDTDGTHSVAGVPGGSGGDGNIAVWTREAQGWTLDHTSTNGVDGSSYGYAVAIAGSRVLVGAPGATHANLPNAGSAVLTRLLLADDLPSVTLYDPTPAQSELFGTAVAATAMRFAVGSIHDDAPGGDPDAGAVHVFRLVDDDAQLERALRAPVPREGSRFGFALAFTGSRLVVGEPSRELFIFGSSLPNAGAAYVFRNLPEARAAEGGWDLVATLYNFGANEQMGYRVAAADGRVEAGVPTRDAAAQADVGAVDVYEPDRIFADDFE